MNRRKIGSLSAALATFSLIFGGLLVSSSSRGATDPEASRLEAEGTAAFLASDFDLARRRFGEAEAAATRARDWGTLLFLTFDYLALTPLDPGHETDNNLGARTTFVNATSITYDMATFSPDRSGSGRDCPEGVAGAQVIVAIFDLLLSPGLTPGDEFDTFRAQRDIAASVTCIPAPSLSPVPSPTPTPTPTPSASPTGTTFNFDAPFGTPQYFVHSTGHSTISGDVIDDFHFLFPAPPVDGRLEVPDGSGGTFTYKIDYSSGPFTTPREVCSAAKARGVGNQSYNAWNSNTSFDCSQLPG